MLRVCLSLFSAVQRDTPTKPTGEKENGCSVLLAVVGGYSEGRHLGQDFPQLCLAKVMFLSS